MKTLVQKGTNLSVYVFDDAESVDIQQGAVAVGSPVRFLIGDMNADNAELRSVSDVPADWVGGKYKFDGLIWSYASSDPSDLQKNIVEATQQRLDDFARTRNYDGILSLCTYATSTNAKFQAEGQYGVEARDATWAKLYEILAEVEAGTRPVPTGYAEIEPELPALVWPQ